MKENLYTPDCIRTFTGLYMNVFEPTPEMICIEDIAHSLANQCRFAGHLPKWYSVAQHCVNCSHQVEQAFKIEALLHDASEAYILDMPKPIKDRMPEYKKIERKLMGVIAAKFGFQYPLSKDVKSIDHEFLKYEWDVIMLGNNYGSPDEYWDSQKAEKRFLEHYRYLSVLDKKVELV